MSLDDDIITATIVKAPDEPEEILDAIVVEPKGKPKPPPIVSAPQSPPKPKAKRPTTEAAPARPMPRAASGAASLFIVVGVAAFMLIGVIGIGAIASIWILTRADHPAPIAQGRDPKLLKKEEHNWDIRKEVPKTDRTEVFKTITPTIEKTPAPKTEAPRTEYPKTEAPKTEAPKTEAPKKEYPKTEAPKTEAPKTETPKVEKIDPEVENKPEPGTKHVTRIVLLDEAGKYIISDQLAKSDSRKLGKVKAAYKAYVVPLVAGQSYDFHQRSDEIDSVLELFDPAGKRIAVDDDSGGGLDARILYDVKTSGTYRLIATSFKEDLGRYTLSINRVTLPIAVAVNEPMKVEREQRDECRVTEVTFRVASSLHSVVWARDGKAVFTLGADKLLRRIRVPEFVEDRQLGVEEDSVRIYQTAEGLIVHRTISGMLWLVDPATLEIRRRINMATKQVILTSPESSKIVVVINHNPPDGKAISRIVQLDLSENTPTSVAMFLGHTRGLALTPDTRYLFNLSPLNKLSRIRLKLNTLDIEQTGDVVKSMWTNRPVVISPDGEMLFQRAMTTDLMSGIPTSAAIDVFRVADISKPAMKLETGLFASQPACDPKTGNIYVYGATKGLMVFDNKGKLVRTFAVADPKPGLPKLAIMHMEANPKGESLLMFRSPASSSAVYVELPSNLAALPIKKIPDPKPKQVGEHDFNNSPLQVGDMQVHRVLTGSTVRPMWTPDGKFFFAVQKPNIVQKWNDADLKVVAEATVKEDDKAVILHGELAESADGLLVLGRREGADSAQIRLFVLDPNSLEVKRSFACPHAGLVRSSPVLGRAFVGGWNSLDPTKQPQLQGIDLKTGELAKPESGTFPLHHEAFQVSPDGKKFFGTDGKSVARFTISGKNLIHEETGYPKLLVENVALRLELFGDYAWLMGLEREKMVAPEKSVTMIMHANKLNHIYKGYNFRLYAVGIDTPNQRVFLSNTSLTLEVSSTAKPPRPRYTWKCDTPRQITMNPITSTMLMQCGEELFYMQLPGKGMNVPKAP